MEARLYVVQDGQVLEEADVLEGPGDAVPVDVGGLFYCDVHAVQEDDSCIRLIYTCQKVENRCFSGSVGADEAVELALFDLYGKVTDRLESPEGDAEALRPEVPYYCASFSGFLKV